MTLHDVLAHALDHRCPTCSAHPGAVCHAADESTHPARLVLGARIRDAVAAAHAARAARRGPAAGPSRLRADQ